MARYDFNLENFGKLMLPLRPYFRDTFTVKWIKVCLSGVQWLRDTVFNGFWKGLYENDTPPPLWDELVTYNKGNFVYYFNRKVYQSKVDNNIGNEPTLNLDKWILVNESYIGLNERINWNAQFLILEYALNRWFGTNFAQPDGAPPSYTRVTLPDIYLVNNSIYLSQGYFTNNSDSSSFSSKSQDTTMYFSSVSAAISQFDFTIYFPLAVFDLLAPTNDERENVIKGFVNKYIYAGIKYNIVTY